MQKNDLHVILELHHAQQRFHLEKMVPEFVELLSEDHISVSRAACRGPEGAYRSTVEATADGYMVFRQDYSYRGESFQAVMLNDSTGFILGATKE